MSSKSRKTAMYLGMWSLYDEYRNGAKRPVYVPGKGVPGPLMNKDKFEQTVTSAMEQMAHWRSSKFEFEGPMRAGLRSGLCLDGHDWHRSDDAAARVTSEALHRMRAVRPTYEQAQPGYVEARENCARCGAPVEMGNLHKAYRFCSDICAKAAVEAGAAERKNETDRVYAAAQRLIKRARNKPRNCKWCGGEFRPVREAGNQQFCSSSCHGKNNQANAPERTCTCEVCGEPFRTKSNNARYCSGPCCQLFDKMKKGHAPRQLRRHVFDHYFTMPINASRPAWLTPERFDELVAA